MNALRLAKTQALPPTLKLPKRMCPAEQEVALTEPLDRTPFVVTVGSSPSATPCSSSLQ